MCRSSAEGALSLLRNIQSSSTVGPALGRSYNRPSVAVVPASPGGSLASPSASSYQRTSPGNPRSDTPVSPSRSPLSANARFRSPLPSPAKGSGPKAHPMWSVAEGSSHAFLGPAAAAGGEPMGLSHIEGASVPTGTGAGARAGTERSPSCSLSGCSSPNSAAGGGSGNGCLFPPLQGARGSHATAASALFAAAAGGGGGGSASSGASSPAGSGNGTGRSSSFRTASGAGGKEDNSPWANGDTDRVTNLTGDGGDMEGTWSQGRPGGLRRQMSERHVDRPGLGSISRSSSMRVPASEVEDNTAASIGTAASGVGCETSGFQHQREQQQVVDDSLPTAATAAACCPPTGTCPVGSRLGSAVVRGGMTARKGTAPPPPAAAIGGHYGGQRLSTNITKAQQQQQQGEGAKAQPQRSCLRSAQKVPQGLQNRTSSKRLSGRLQRRSKEVVEEKKEEEEKEEEYFFRPAIVPMDALQQLADRAEAPRDCTGYSQLVGKLTKGT